jgi:flagellar basal body-associated protein FliL
MISFSAITIPCYYRKALIAVYLCLAVLACGKLAATEPENLSDIKGLDKNASGMVNFIYFNNFMIYRMDKRDQKRLLTCDVAVELNQGARLSRGKAELRKIIYRLLKYQFNVVEMRGLAKDKIKTDLNQRMAAEIIKNVYFTKLLLL